MKKRLIVLMAVVLIVGSFAMIACGDGGSDITGKYILDSVETDGVTFKSNQLEDIGFADTYLELKSNGSAILTFVGESKDATYTVEGKTLSLTAEGDETYNMKIDGDTLIREMDDNTLNFKK